METINRLDCKCSQSKKNSLLLDKYGSGYVGVLLISPTHSSPKYCITILEHMLLPSLIMCLDGKLLPGIREVAVQHLASELNQMTLCYKGMAKYELTTGLSAGSKAIFVGSSAGYCWEVCPSYNHLFKSQKVGEKERGN